MKKQTILFCLLLGSAMARGQAQTPTTNTTEDQPQQTLVAEEHLLQKIQCIYLIESFCASERLLFYVNPVCAGCYHYLSGEAS